MFVPIPTRMRPCTRLDASIFRRDSTTPIIDVEQVYRQYFVENGIPVEVKRERVWTAFFAHRRRSTPLPLVLEANKTFHVVGTGQNVHPTYPIPKEDDVMREERTKKPRQRSKSRSKPVTATLVRPDLEIRRLPDFDVSERHVKTMTKTTPDRGRKRSLSGMNEWPGSTGLRNVHFLSSTDIETISSSNETESASNESVIPDISPRFPRPFQRPNLLRKYMLRR